MEESATMIRLDDHSREERYFSGTILPYLLAYDNFLGLKEFLLYLNKNVLADNEKLVDLKNFHEDIKTIQLIAEPALERDLSYYGVPILPECFQQKMGKQTKPDLLIIIGRCAILIEAKYFTRYSSYKLYQQMQEQAYIAEVVKSLSSGELLNCLQLAICPFHQALEKFPVITWKEIYEMMRTIVPDENYFLSRLKYSIGRL